MKSKTVIVTGSGQGIGRAIAIQFAPHGFNVVIADVNLAAAQSTAKQIEANGGKAIYAETDVADAASVQRLIEKTINSFGSIDVLVNNAAVQVNKTVEHTEVKEWERELLVNVSGMFLCSKFALPHLKASKGSIVSISSVNAFFAEANCAGYCATKGAIIGLTKAMAIDHGKDGVRVNCICPGYIDAGTAQGYFDIQPDPTAARIAAGKLHALHRIGTAEEVAKAAVFLASDEASFITGAALVVDGGLSSGIAPA